MSRYLRPAATMFHRVAGDPRFWVDGAILPFSADEFPADALSTEAVDLARQGMATSPNDVGPQELFTQVAIFRGHVLATRGRVREAVVLADEAITMKRVLIERSGDVVSGPMMLAVR